MKSLEETIADFTDLSSNRSCMSCPFEDEDRGILVCLRGSCIDDDVIHYLKELKESREE